MLVLALNAICAAFCLNITRLSFSRSVTFTRSGWLIVESAVKTPDYRHNVEAHRTISAGGWLLMAGILWGIGGIIAAGAFLFFAVEAWRLIMIA